MSTYHLGNQGIQLIFANQNDVYYRDDLVRLNLKDYLYAGLRENGINKVLFIRRRDTKGAKGYAAEAYDEKSYRIFVKEARSVFESFKQIDRSDYRSEKECTDKQVLEMMTEYPDTAFVITAQDFAELFQKNPSDAAFLKEEKGRSLLILASPDADESFLSFFDPESVFRTMRNGVPLFPELDAVFSQNKKSGSYYRELRSRMQNRSILLSLFTEDSLTNVVRYALWKYRSVREYEEEDVAPTAAFIAAWYRSPKMQAAFPGALTRNVRLQYRTVENDIRVNWTKLQQFREIWEKNKEDYPLYEERPLYTETVPVRLVEQIRAGRALHAGQHVDTALWNRISYYLQVPAPETFNEESRKRIRSCLYQIQNADNLQDEATVRYGERCLEYWLSPAMEENRSIRMASSEQREKIKNTYEQMIKISSARFTIQQQMKALRESIQQWDMQRKELHARIAAIADREGISLQGSEEEIAGIQNTELFNCMFEYTDIKRRIEWNRGILNKLLKDATQYQKSLTALETTIRLSDTMAVEDMEKTLEESREILLEYGKQEEEKEQTYQETVSQERLLDDLLKGRFTPTLEEELRAFHEDEEEQLHAENKERNAENFKEQEALYSEEELRIMNEF